MPCWVIFTKQMMTGEILTYPYNLQGMYKIPLSICPFTSTSKVVVYDYKSHSNI